MGLSLTSDHCRVLSFLWTAGQYTPGSDLPILGDENRTQEALTDAMSMPEPPVKTSCLLTKDGIALCHALGGVADPSEHDEHTDEIGTICDVYGIGDEAENAGGCKSRSIRDTGLHWERAVAQGDSNLWPCP